MVVHGVLVRVCVLRSVLTFLKSSVHLRVGEKLEGEVTWPWQTGQHFTPTLMQHGTRTSPHTAERGREGGKGGRERSAVRHHCKAATVHGDTDAGSGLIELRGLSPEAHGAEGDIVTFQLETDSHLEHQVR